MFCQNCGKEIDHAALFCPYCGAGTGTESAAVPTAQPTNKTEAFIAERNAQKGVAPVTASSASGGTMTEEFIAKRQAEKQTPVTSPVVPPVPPMPQTPQAPQAPYTAAPVQAPQAPQMPSPPAYPHAPQAQASVPPVPPTPAYPQAKKKGFPGWAVALIIVGALLIVGTVSAVVIGSRIKKEIKNYGSEVQSELEDLFESTQSYDESTTAESILDFSQVGRPEEKDFAWFQGIPQDYPSGSTRLQKAEEINGRWKAYYVIDGGVKELVNIDIAAGNRAATVTIDPYMINYEGLQWEYESTASPYAYEGAIDAGTITAHSEQLGTLRLYGFYQKDGSQYAFGDTMLQSGETVVIAMVRP